MDRFSLCLPFTLAQERNVATAQWGDSRNFDNDPHDSGGATQDGITQAECTEYRAKLGKPNQSVRLINSAEGSAIYRGYWEPHCPQLPAGLDMSFFDSNVNEGLGEAINILQVALGIKETGRWDDATTAAVAAIKDVPAVVKSFTARRGVVYEETKGFKYFGNDWERRDKQIGTTSLQMASAVVVAKPIVQTPAAPAKTTTLLAVLWNKCRGRA